MLLTRPRRGLFSGAGFPEAGSLFWRTMADLDEQKRALRARVRALLPRPGSPEAVAASVAAQERLLASPFLAETAVVGLYRALPSECGTASLAASLEARGTEVCYPASAPDRLALRFRR